MTQVTRNIAKLIGMALAALSVPAYAGEQDAPKLIFETEGLPSSESILFNEKDALFYVSVMGGDEEGDGRIAKVDMGGEIVDPEFITGLNDPKGSIIIGNYFFVADGTELAAIDLHSKKMTKFAAPGAVFLNDVIADGAGHIYLSDTGQSAIYKFDPEAGFSMWLKSDDLNHPNGLLIIRNTLYVASWGERDDSDPGSVSNGKVLSVDMETKKISPVSQKTIGNVDGIQRYGADEFMISEWRGGKIYKLSADGITTEILDVGRSVGDIRYVPAADLLAVPMNRQSKMMLYKMPAAD